MVNTNKDHLQFSWRSSINIKLSFSVQHSKPGTTVDVDPRPSEYGDSFRVGVY